MRDARQRVASAAARRAAALPVLAQGRGPFGPGARRLSDTDRLRVYLPLQDRGGEAAASHTSRSRTVPRLHGAHLQRMCKDAGGEIGTVIDKCHALRGAVRYPWES